MQKYKTLIILDWDDTLFPTSWIAKNNINLTDIDVQNKYIVYFSKLDTLLYQLLYNLMKYGKVIIITNAVNKWVMLSSLMLPNTQKLLHKYITVYSAREEYEIQYPQQSNIWKQLLFKKITDEYFMNHDLQNIISIGDAEYEFYAMTNLFDKQAQTKQKLLKTIRFMKDPSFDILIDQVDVLTKASHNILTRNNHIDLLFIEQ